jgi:predicted SprT family Zn-dependent metalloprotease
MQNLKAYTSYLRLTKPVTITVKTRSHKAHDAYYMPKYSDRTAKLLEHKIVIYVENMSRSFDTLLAHELIHAWQEEKGLAEFHGKQFQRMAKRMGEYFGLQNIYIEGTDI